MNNKLPSNKQMSKEFRLFVGRKSAKTVLKGLSSVMEDEEIDAFKKTIQGKTVEGFGVYQTFLIGIVFPFKRFLTRIIFQTVSPNPKVIFIISNALFIQKQFLKIIEKTEGVTEARDKTMTIMEGLVNFYKDNTRISFNYDSKNTYHLPKKVFTTHEEITDFFESVYSLYYGDSSRFIELSMPYNQMSSLDDNNKKYASSTQYHLKKQMYEDFWNGVVGSKKEALETLNRLLSSKDGLSKMIKPYVYSIVQMNGYIKEAIPFNDVEIRLGGDIYRAQVKKTYSTPFGFVELVFASFAKNNSYGQTFCRLINFTNELYTKYTDPENNPGFNVFFEERIGKDSRGNYYLRLDVKKIYESTLKQYIQLGVLNK